MRTVTLSPWIASGAALGVSLSLAEVCVGYLAGGRFPLAWWGFLAVYYVPLLATVGALLGLLRGRAGTHASPAAAARLAADALAFLYFVVAVNHEYLKGISFHAHERAGTVALGAVLAWLHAGHHGRPVAGRQAEPGHALAVQLARPLLQVAAAWCAVSIVRVEDRLAASLAFLLLAFALAALAGAGLARLLLAGTGGRRLALGGAL